MEVLYTHDGRGSIALPFIPPTRRSLGADSIVPVWDSNAQEITHYSFSFIVNVKPSVTPTLNEKNKIYINEGRWGAWICNKNVNHFYLIKYELFLLPFWVFLSFFWVRVEKWNCNKTDLWPRSVWTVATPDKLYFHSFFFQSFWHIFSYTWSHWFHNSVQDSKLKDRTVRSIYSNIQTKKHNRECSVIWNHLLTEFFPTMLPSKSLLVTSCGPESELTHLSVRLGFLCMDIVADSLETARMCDISVQYVKWS